MDPDAGSMRRCPDWSERPYILRHELEFQNQGQRNPVRHWENRAMRNDGTGFTGISPVPSPSPSHASLPLRFAVLWHSFPQPHWDWMFEKDGELATFRSAPNCLEVLRGGITQVWTQLPGHRKHYLDYEGPVSGNRGEVKRIMGGTCRWLEEADQVIRLELSSPDFSGYLSLLSTTHPDQWETRWIGA